MVSVCVYTRKIFTLVSKLLENLNKTLKSKHGIILISNKVLQRLNVEKIHHKVGCFNMVTSELNIKA